MCGIAVNFAYQPDAPPVDRAELLAIRDQMVHRGPDGEGLWISPDGRVGLAHRRLSIIDISDAGAQPMWNAERTLGIVYNGEIYNFETLRAGLIEKGYQFQSHCDTEVLLHLYAERGAAMMDDLRGMYAFAIWDTRSRTLFCARDPFGIKPLYYAAGGGVLRLASQVKALLTCRCVDHSVEPAGPVGFFLWGAVPDPFTMYRGIRGLPAGHTLTLREGGEIELRSFSNIAGILHDAQQDTTLDAISPARRQEWLHEALRDSAEKHLIADVPVGVFLSAGLDSSTLTALVSETHPDVRTVTLAFGEYRGTENDETALAEVVAKHYQTDHQTISITRRDFEENAAHLFDVMDRPSIDGVNTYFVSLAARRAGLKVALSGVGGDELFGGYPSFQDVPRLVREANRWRGLTRIGRPLRIVTQGMIRRFTSPKYAGLFEYGSSYAGAYLLRRSLFAPWELPGILHPDLVREGWERLHTLGRLGEICDSVDTARVKVSALELSWYMRHQLLRDSDWAGMAHSLEIRTPLVDVALLKKIAPLLVSKTPPSKRDLALSPEKPLPDVILNRPKTGFSVPVRDWLLQSFDPTSASERGLRGWAREVYARQSNPLLLHRHSLQADRRRHGQRSAKMESTKCAKLHAIVLLSDGFGGFGGIAKFNRDFMCALASHPQMAEVQAVARLMPNDPGEVPSNVTLVRGSLGGKRKFIRAAIEVARAVKKRAGDEPVLIFCGHINLSPLAAIVQRVVGGSVHLIIHGIDAWRTNRNPAVRASLSTLSGFITVSHVTKQRFQRWTGLRSDQGVILPNCVDLKVFSPGPRSPVLQSRYGLNGAKVIMTFGRLESAERYKGFDEVIEVLPQLAPVFPGITYLVCGDGHDRARLVAKAREEGCNVFDYWSADRTTLSTHHVDDPRPRVIFTGRVDEREKVDHYRLADAYVMPSSGEGFGIVYLEALACGIPAIGSKADGSREALRDGRLGQLVDPTSPLEIVRAIANVLNANGSGIAAVDREALSYFSSENFERRVHAIVDGIADR